MQIIKKDMQKLYLFFTFSVFLSTTDIISSDQQVQSFFTKLSYTKTSGDDDSILMCNNFGTVSVQGWMKPQALVVAHVASQSLSGLADYVLQVRHKKNRTEISVANFPKTVHNADLVDCQVFVPKSAIVRVETYTGTISADSLFGKRNILKTSMGDIYASDCSNIYASTDCGQIDIRSGLRVAHAFSEIGHICIEGHFDGIKAYSYEGDITVMSNLKKPNAYSEFGSLFLSKPFPK